MYLDNILVFSKHAANYKSYYKKVIRRLLDARLYLDARKCKFLVKRIKYLRIILTTKGLEIDPKKVKAILE
jgi:hypothetical protein